MDATLYDELHLVERTHWWFQARRQIVWSLVQRYVDGSPNRRLRICELGCGTGGNLIPLAHSHDIVGVECSPAALAYAREELGNCVQFGLLPDEIDLPSASFDVVLMTDVLEHIENDRASAATALRLLRPGGVVVATVPAYQWLYSPRDAQHHHFRRYSKGRFAQLWNRDDARTVLLSHYNTVLFPPAAAVRLTAKVIPTSAKAGDLAIPPRSLNRLLARLMGCEAHLLGRLPFPFGLSLVAVVRKTHPTTSTQRRAPHKTRDHLQSHSTSLNIFL